MENTGFFGGAPVNPGPSVELLAGGFSALVQPTELPGVRGAGPPPTPEATSLASPAETPSAESILSLLHWHDVNWHCLLYTSDAADE